MLAGVIFDFDGVIVDSHPAHIQSWKAFLHSKRKAVSEAELSFVREGAKREEILRHFLGELTAEQVESYGAEKNKLFQAHAGELKLVRGFAGFLSQLDNVALPSAVATSGSRGRVEQTFKHSTYAIAFALLLRRMMLAEESLIRLYSYWPLKPCKSMRVAYWYLRTLLLALWRPKVRG